MNSITCRSILAGATAALTTLTLTTGASAADRPTLSYAFRQDGYADGAFVAGSFSGVDRDENGILVYFPADGGTPPIEADELTALSLTFSGNSAAPAFSLGLDDLFGFVFEIDSGDLGDDPAFEPTLGTDLAEGIGAHDEMYFYTSGNGPNGFIGGYVGGEIEIGSPDAYANAALDSSQQRIQVTRIPEPTPALLLLTAVLAIGRKNKRKLKTYRFIGIPPEALESSSQRSLHHLL